MRVLGLSGSLREGSHNGALLRAAAAALPAGVELEIWDGLRKVPPFDEDAEGGPAPVAVGELRRAIAAADAVLVATPEYNGSLPGQLKNALDWVSRPHATNPLRGKPAAVVGASTGLFGAVWAQADGRRVLTTIGAEVLDAELPVGTAHEAFGAGGELLDDGMRDALQALLDDLLATAGAVCALAA
jgi:chromate reductase